MQEKPLLNQANSTSNIHSSEFGAIFYDIFGNPYQKSGSFLATDSLDFGYFGKPYNADSELYDYGFRDYSPKIARFTTVDPIRDGRNWYCYVVNDPVNYVDLWGLQCKSSNDRDRIAEGEARLQNLASKVDKLPDLVNVENLAKIFSDNIDLFDSETAKYYSNMPDCVRESAIRSELNKVTVYSGIDGVEADKILGEFGSDFLSGLSLGENIYIEEEVSYVTTSIANLIGHEGAHTVQASVVGKEEFIMYCATMPYTDENVYEAAAYKFGGSIDLNNFPKLESYNGGNQVLSQNKGWYK